ncbi:hypothetical protein H072_10308 [Dactylellina haptotyla CBS 200.50]|uniref:Aminoglycoside phosphotransferase domain-containing protein n=1 Tax=Dactylellina haptotyla (strain CBS 200.50) TaxID=1284197 RepID=S8A0K7_DACHA|nr:hypothetical protein H072_10308 [Dactylellina haptotyla CBS 200.50]
MEDIGRAADDAERQSLREHNISVIQRMQKFMEDDTSKDLSSYFTHLQNDYSKRRQVLEQKAGRKAQIATEDTQTVEEEEEEEEEEKPQVTVDVRKTLQIKRDVEVFSPVSEKLISLLPESESESSEENETTGSIYFITFTQLDGLNDMIRKSKIIHNLGKSFVLDLGFDIVVKVGRNLDIEYLDTLRDIRDHAPDIPVPETYAILEHEDTGICHIFMSKLEGQSLNKIWSTLSVKQKQSVQTQLDDLFRQLRLIKNEFFEWGGGGTRRCKDIRKREIVAQYPIFTEGHFNRFLLQASGYNKPSPRREMLNSFLRTDHKVKLTHGDLHPRNICAVLARETPTDGNEEDQEEIIIKVTGILDWDSSGWYPEYWEYVKAINTICAGDGMEDWWQYLPTNAIGKWPNEYAIYMLISQD